MSIAVVSYTYSKLAREDTLAIKLHNDNNVKHCNACCMERFLFCNTVTDVTCPVCVTVNAPPDVLRYFKQKQRVRLGDRRWSREMWKDMEKSPNRVGHKKNARIDIFFDFVLLSLPPSLPLERTSISWCKCERSIATFHIFHKQKWGPSMNAALLYAPCTKRCMKWWTVTLILRLNIVKKTRWYSHKIFI